MGRTTAASRSDESIVPCDIKRKHRELSIRSLSNHPKNGDLGSAQHLLSLENSTDEMDPLDKCRQTSIERKNYKDCRNFRLLEHGMPKSVAYLQRSQCDFVKNIHIDKAEICKNKCLVENCELDHIAISFLLDPNENDDNESLGDNLDSVMFPLDEPKMCIFQESTQDSRTCSPEKMIKRKEDGRTTDEHETSTCQSTKQTLPDASHDVRRDLETENKFLPDDSVPGNVARSIQLCLDSKQDSSFNAADPLLIQIKELMQTPYCGSISFRSNSSTASSQSFAFPLLPSEWSGSPIKMAKPDHRQSKKQGRLWQMIFMCCKF